MVIIVWQDEQCLLQHCIVECHNLCAKWGGLLPYLDLLMRIRKETAPRDDLPLSVQNLIFVSSLSR